MMKVTVIKVDAFTRDNTGGSPTSVVLDADGLSASDMQHIAEKMNSSHTAFVFEKATSDREIVGVRFFTPQREILNCGHGTIAAHYARTTKLKLKGNITLHQLAKEGLQKIEIIQEETGRNIFLEQNEIRFSEVTQPIKDELTEILGIHADGIDETFPLVLASPGSSRFLVGVKLMEELNSIQPNFDGLLQLCDHNSIMGCFVYCLQPGKTV